MTKDVIEEMYLTKNTDYFSLERQMFKNSVQDVNLKILDIGCGTGVLGAFFKKNQNCYVAGVEINQSAYELALQNLDTVIKGNFETLDLPFENNFFDIVIMGDVLEHLVDPIRSIHKILPLINNQGKILITVPNVRNWRVVKSLVFNDNWQYADWGILDYTHMRFFTKKSLQFLLLKQNIEIINIERLIQNPSKSYIFNKLTFGIFEGFLASHIFLTIKKSTNG